MPQIECAVALLVCNTLSFHSDGVRRAIVPQPGSAPADRAITFAGLGRIFAQEQPDPPAVATSLMLAHPRIFSTLRDSSLAEPFDFYAALECPQWVGC